MKLVKLIFFVLVMALALLLSMATASTFKDKASDDEDTTIDRLDDSLTHGEELASLPGIGRFLRQRKHRRRMTCKKFPSICYAKGSPGTHCCKKKCVNVLRDRLNCGRCGKKCNYMEICCQGKCVNPSFNSRHCGGCNNKCSSGGFCLSGLCNYA